MRIHKITKYSMKIGFATIIISLISIMSSPAQSSSLIDQINAKRELRSKIMADLHRPTYHFVAPEGLSGIFDPNGAIFWNGKYHLGFIYQKYAQDGSKQHVWGHAVSADLFHWTLFPDILKVKKGDPEVGIFSGGAFVGKDDVRYIFYHAWGADGNSAAFSKDDDLKDWIKVSHSTMLKSPDENDSLYEKYLAWDPDGWYENGFYYQISGGSTTVPASFWKSKDLVDWQYLGDFIDQEKKIHFDFEDISCPDFFKLDEQNDKYMLLFISHRLGAQYYIGEYKNERFTNFSHGRMNWPGGTFFAPEQLKDDKGRNIIWGWVRDERPEPMQIASGWSGTLSLPRVVSSTKDNVLQIHPPEEIEMLRLDSVSYNNIIIKPGGEEKLDNIKGRALEIKLKIEKPHDNIFGIKVFCSPDGREETLIEYNGQQKELIINFEKSSTNKDIKFKKHIMRPDILPEKYLGYTNEQRALLNISDEEALDLRIFIDHSIVEVFANGQLCMTQRVYPMLPESTFLSIYNDESSKKVEFKEIQIWNIAEANYY